MRPAGGRPKARAAGGATPASGAGRGVLPVLAPRDTAMQMARPRLHEGCIVEDCDRPHSSRGYCKPHYLRWYRHGDPLAGRADDGRSLRERFFAYVEKTEGCWRWLGSVDR